MLSLLIGAYGQDFLNVVFIYFIILKNNKINNFVYITQAIFSFGFNKFRSL